MYLTGWVISKAIRCPSFQPLRCSVLLLGAPRQYRDPTMRIMCYLCWPGVFASVWLSSGAGGAVGSNCTDVDCRRTIGTSSQKLPVRSETDFNEGYYCVCDDVESIARTEQCPLDGACGRQRLDSDKQECVCWSAPPEDPSDRGACLLLDCTRLLNTPINVVDPSAEECEDGYYCYCASSRAYATRLRCPINHYIQFWYHQRFNAAAQACVPRNEVECVNSISTSTPATTNSPSTPSTTRTATATPQPSACTTAAESLPHPPPEPTVPSGFSGQAGYKSSASQFHLTAMALLTLTLLQVHNCTFYKVVSV